MLIAHMAVGVVVNSFVLSGAEVTERRVQSAGVVIGGRPYSGAVEFIRPRSASRVRPPPICRSWEDLYR